MNTTPSAACKPPRNRPRPGGHLSRHLHRNHLGDSADDLAPLVANFWLTPSAVTEIVKDEDQPAFAAAVRQTSRSPAGAALKAEHRRADAERKRWSAAAQLERGLVRAPHDAAATSAPRLSAFQRADLAAARGNRIRAAAANLWRKLACRREHFVSAAPRPPVSRPRARRSHRVVARATKASGDSGDSDGEPPTARAVELGAAHPIAQLAADTGAKLRRACLEVAR